MFKFKKQNFLFLSLFLNVLFCKNPIEEKCEFTCNFAEKCALEAQKNVTIDSKSLERIHIQCLGACTMFQQEFLTCAEQSRNSCKGFYECILSSGVFN